MSTRTLQEVLCDLAEHATRLSNESINGQNAKGIQLMSDPLLQGDPIFVRKGDGVCFREKYAIPAMPAIQKDPLASKPATFEEFWPQGEEIAAVAEAASAWARHNIPPHNPRRRELVAELDYIKEEHL